MYCRNCGNKLDDNANFCTVCGTRVECSEVNNHIQNMPNDTREESRFEQFMSKHFFTNTENMSVEDMKKISNILSIVMVVLQFIRILCIFFDWSTSFLFVGELACVLGDWYFLSRLGVRGAWKLWGLFIYPVYLFIKVTKTDKKYLCAIICVVIMVGGIVLSMGGGSYGGTVVKPINAQKISNAEHIVKQYFEEEYVKGLVGYYFEYSDVRTTENADGTITASFDMKKLNKYIDDDSDVYYVEFLIGEYGIEFGYTPSKEFSEYLQDAYGAPMVTYTMYATWEGEYTEK